MQMMNSSKMNDAGYSRSLRKGMKTRSYQMMNQQKLEYK